MIDWKRRIYLIAAAALFALGASTTARAAESVTFRVIVKLVAMGAAADASGNSPSEIAPAAGEYLVSRTRVPFFRAAEGRAETSRFVADEAFTVAAEPRDRLHFRLKAGTSEGFYAPREGILLFDKGGRAIFGDQTMKVAQWSRKNGTLEPAAEGTPVPYAVLRVTVVPIRAMRRPARS